MKTFYPKLVLISLLLFSFSVPAQDNCTLLTQTSTALLNLRVGIPVEEVRNKLGTNLGIKTNKKGDYRFFQNYIDKKPPVGLSGVRAFYLRFFEKKLYQAEIFYDENKYPADIKNFAEIISAELGLPLAEWKFAHRQAVFSCGDVSLEIDYQLNPRIELTDEKAQKQVDETNKKTKLF
jgi:hypothetical protein